MSDIDPEVLYLILTKVASKERFYTLDGSTDTITPRQLGEVYERITGSRVGSRVNWEPSLKQLNLLLKKCKLPSLGDVLSVDGTVADPVAAIGKTKWPTFGELKKRFTG
jgi:hypothetical protein